jgi:hypothetical protein
MKNFIRTENIQIRLLFALMYEFSIIRWIYKINYCDFIKVMIARKTLNIYSNHNIYRRTNFIEKITYTVI